MPAKSKAQQAFFGMVKKAQQGGKPASPAIAKAAEGMKMSSVDKFASTKTKGLPRHAVMSAIKKKVEAKKKK